MAEVKALRALRFTPKAGDIKELACPPYDIISEEERKAYLNTNPCNIIRLELPREGENQYAVAADLYTKWLAEGILAQDEQPGLYIYEEEFEALGATHKVKGLQCRVKLTEFSEGVVLPHEETLSKAKADRFELMKACGTNFSSIYSLYFDQDRALRSLIDSLSEGEPTQSWQGQDGVIHRLWCVYDAAVIAKIEGLFADKKLYIADGHHRYETALNYRRWLAEQGIPTGDAEYILMTLVNMEHEGLVVFPTHRIIRDLEGYDTAAVLEACGAMFEIGKVEGGLEAAQALLDSKYAQGKIAFVLYDGSYHCLTLTDEQAMAKIAPDHSEAWQGLDVSVLHSLVLERCMGIDKENMANQKNLTYTRSADEAFAAAENGADACFILNPTRVEEIAAVSREGEKMPQKSTYFYPKLITGLVMNKIL
jgi:uncharacterized protein (DUF1015 family)